MPRFDEMARNRHRPNGPRTEIEIEGVLDIIIDGSLKL